MRTLPPTLRALFLAALAATASPAEAACPDDAAVERLAGDILARRPSKAPAVETMADGICGQEKLVAILAREWGAPAGYKAALTSAPAQAAFGVSAPVRGTLFGEALLEDGATVSAAYGTLPRFEADMVAVVGDAGINEATTPGEVLEHLAAIRPFIELPDLVVADPRGLSAPQLAAINAGARTGVLGEPVDMQAGEGFLAALAAMTVSVIDQEGRELAAAPGAAVLGHPLNAILWLREAGVEFRPGDLVSLGSFGPLMEPRPGLTATVTYEGLPGNPSVSVTFE